MAAGFTVRQRSSLLQVLPVQQLHRVVRTLVGEAIIEDFDDAGVLEPHQRVELALEQGFEGTAPGTRSLGAQLLERDHALSHAILGAVDDAHASGAELAEQHIAVVFERQGVHLSDTESPHERDKRSLHPVGLRSALPS